MTHSDDMRQWQLDREQERRIKDEEFRRAHPEFDRLGSLHPVMRAALAPLVVKQKEQKS